MRFIHTADWHLGKSLYGVDLIDDQAYLLDQLISLAKDVRPDAMLIAGDVFDRAVPPPSALALLDGALSRAVLDLKMTVVLIAGNHDSAQRLGFTASVLARQRLHVAGRLSADASGIAVQGEDAVARVYPLPYCEAASARTILGDSTLRSQDDVVSAGAQRIRAAHPPRLPGVVVAHGWVRGGRESGSERKLSASENDLIEPEHLGGFDYVAMGHLHAAQSIHGTTIHYPGSLLKYSFAEADDVKGVKVVDVRPGGGCEVRFVPLTPRREMRRVRGRLVDVLSAGERSEGRNDYVHVTLEDEGPVLDAMDKIRTVYPNALAMEFSYALSRMSRLTAELPHHTLEEETVFRQFYQEVTGTALSDSQAMALAREVDRLRSHDREAER